MFDLFQGGKAAIHYAAEGGHLNIIKFLIENGVDPSVKSTEVRIIDQTFCLTFNFLIMYFWNVNIARNVNMAPIIYDNLLQSL